MRERNILCQRFGLKNKKECTLQEIGQYYGRSRERIRQIQDKALTEIKNRKKYQPILNILEKIFVKHSQIASEEKLSQEFGEHQAPYFFILNLDDSFFKFCDNENFKCHWATDIQISKQARKSIINLIKYLEKINKPISEKEILKYISQEHLDIAKLISKNIFNQFGLVDWPEITPRGVKDKAFIILRHKQKPLHFREITDLINQAEFSDQRIATTQTVHNELIKDPRFILEGRGIYGLSNNSS